MSLCPEHFVHLSYQLCPRVCPFMSFYCVLVSIPLCTYSYMIDNGICYLTLTDKIYPKRLVFLFLEEIARDFVDSLKNEHGEENWRHCVETVGRQYAYIKFDRVIQKKRREYADPNSNINSKKINDDLQSIHTIMRKTIDDVLDRGNKLDGKQDCLCFD